MKKRIINIAFSLVAGFVGAFIFYKVMNPTNTVVIEKNTPPTSFSTLNSALSGEVNFVNASKLSTKSVVYIKTIAEQYETYSWSDLFFGGRMGDRKVVGSGSGVIFSTDGYIVTNNHVIDGASKVKVVYNKKSYDAKIIGTDPSTDLALLKIGASGLPAITVVNSKNLNVGDWVLAVGNPFNLTSTVTAGIVSAKGRRINILEDVFPIESFIQTDAAINPGNSGGALVNINGELVGINSAILSRTGSYTGYGFAIPSNIVVKIVDDLKKFGEVQKAFLGVEIAEVDGDLSDKLGITKLEGVVISNIEKDGAAIKAGLERGDVITEINRQKINSETDFDEELSYHRPGDKINITYTRNNKSYSKEITLTNIEGTTGITKKTSYNATNLGVTLESVPKIERNRLGIQSGVRLTKIKRGLISRMGFPDGFIITSINNYEISDPKELAEIIERIRGRVIIKGVTKEGVSKYFSYYF